ncbi:MAG: helix-turn-helix domain-containing protein [Actinomycetota bacterium]
MPQAAPPSVGIKLRRARIERSLSIEETAWRTRIRPDTLRALELDRFDDVGHPSFVKRNLSSYARFLGMDPQEVVEQFESGHDDLPHAIQELERQVNESHHPPRAKWWIAAGVSAAVLIAGAIAGVLGGSDAKQGTVLPTAPAAPRVVTPAVRVTLGVEVLKATRMSILVDGASVFDGDVKPGDVQTFRGHDTVEILTADGGTVRVTSNGHATGDTGKSGSVYRARFGPSGRISE